MKYIWACDRCNFVVWDGTIEDVGYMSMHLDEDNDVACYGNMLRYRAERDPIYPDPGLKKANHGYHLP